MKKAMTAALLLILVLSLGACAMPGFQEYTIPDEEPEPAQTAAAPEETEMREIPELTVPEVLKNQPTDQTKIPKYVLPDGFTHVEDTVYAKKELHLRTDTSNWANSPGKVKKDEKLHRIGTRNDGWSALYYNDRVYYIMTQYLTTKVPKTTPPAASEAPTAPGVSPETRK